MKDFLLNNKTLDKIDKFIGSYLYICIVAIFSILSWSSIFLFGKEGTIITITTLDTLLLLFATLFAKDGKAFLPIILFLTISFSFVPDTSTLTVPIIFLLIITCFCILTFLAKKFFIFGKVKFTFGSMNKSLLLLAGIASISWLINIFVRDSLFDMNTFLTTLFFVGITFLSIFLSITSNTNNENYKQKYVNYIFIFWGFALILEFFIVCIYSQITVGIPNNGFYELGWGNRATLGKMLNFAMFFYVIEFFKAPKKNFWLIIPWVMSAGIIFFLESRGAQFSLVVSILLIAIYALYKYRKHYIKILEVLVIVSILFVIVCLIYPKIIDVFARFIDIGFNPNGRDIMWEYAISETFSNPVTSIFGCSISYLYELNAIFNVMYVPVSFCLLHNTFVTVMTSFGILGLVALIFHDVDLFYGIFKSTSKETKYFYCVIVAYVICLGVVDNGQFELSISIPLIVMFADLPYTKNKFIGYKNKK